MTEAGRTVNGMNAGADSGVGYVEALQLENKRLRAQLRELRAASLDAVYDPINEREAQYRETAE